jgi:hypothetical protein
MSCAYYFGFYYNKGNYLCGPNVVDMSEAYKAVRNITSTKAVCGDKVVNMAGAYYSCNNLKTPVVGPNVKNMHGTYMSCANLTSAVCGNNVVDCGFAYDNCKKLTTNIGYIGKSAVDIAGYFSDCTNIASANFYIYSNNVTEARNFCCSKYNNKQLIIYVGKNTTTHNTIFKNTGEDSIVGKTITWTTNSICFYNSGYNIYVFTNRTW